MLGTAPSRDGGQGSRNPRPARRRRLITLACGLVLLGLACVGGALASARTHAHSAQSVPDLTGSWRNKVDPNSAPPWRLTASNGLQTLDAAWMGSTANGHPDLRGSFHTTLTQSGGTSFYQGPYRVTEGSAPASTGTITVRIDSDNQIEFSLESDNGGAPQHYVFIRVSSSFTPPSAIDVAPTAALFGAVVVVNAPAPGDEGADVSAPLGDATSADATVSGVSPDDVTFFAAAVIQLARQYCYVQAIKKVTAAFKANPFGIVSSVQAEAGPVYDLLKLASTAILVNAAACMADASTISTVLDQVSSGASADAHAAAAACAVTPFTITLRSSKGRPRPKKVQLAKRKGLSVRCTQSGGTVNFHVASTSGPLRKLVGPRLIVGIARSRHDSPGGTLSFSFHKH
jgi:hypothetical protein